MGSESSPSPVDRILAWVFCPVLVLVAVAWCTIRPLSDPDTWFHMALGREVLTNGTLPRVDIFSHTSAGNEWISSGWLSSVLMQWLFQTFGEGGAGLAGMVFVVVVAANLTVYVTAVRLYGPRTGMVIMLPLLAGVMAAAQRFQPRPDVWSQLFTAVTAALILTAERRMEERAEWTASGRFPRRLWLLPVLFALWANFHAGYFVGFVFVVLFGLHLLVVKMRTADGMRPSNLVFLPLLLCGVTWMLNPYGPGLAKLAGKIAAIPQVLLVYEWMPLVYYPRFAAALPVYCGFALLVLFAGVALARPKRESGRGVRLWHVGAAGVFLGLALLQRRQISLAAIAVPALLIPYLSAFSVSVVLTRWAVTVVAVLLTGGILFFQYAGIYRNEGGGPKVGRTEDLPVYATEFLMNHRPPGLIYNSYGMGGYLLYNLGPATKVFIDGRLDIYDHKVWLDSLAVEDGTLPLDEFLARYDTNTFVIQISDAYGDPQHLATRLSVRQDWRLVHFDDRYGVFVRVTPDTENYLKENAFVYVTPFAPEQVWSAIENLGSRAAAVAEVSRALEQSGAGATSLALAALTSAAVGDSASAQQYLADALARNPSSPPVQMIASQLRPMSGNP